MYSTISSTFCQPFSQFFDRILNIVNFFLWFTFFFLLFAFFLFLYFCCGLVLISVACSCDYCHFTCSPVSLSVCVCVGWRGRDPRPQSNRTGETSTRKNAENGVSLKSCAHKSEDVNGRKPTVRRRNTKRNFRAKKFNGDGDVDAGSGRVRARQQRWRRYVQKIQITFGAERREQRNRISRNMFESQHVAAGGRGQFETSVQSQG